MTNTYYIRYTAIAPVTGKCNKYVTSLTFNEYDLDLYNIRDTIVADIRYRLLDRGFAQSEIEPVVNSLKINKISRYLFNFDRDDIYFEF